jgi:excisionase family DNA binding protein
MSNATVLTTGQVAKICKVAPRTVSKWFDRGQLQGYKIPGSRDRRIPVRQLVAFMKEHGMPTDELDAHVSTTLLLITRQDSTLARAITTSLNGQTHIEIAQTLFEAGGIYERRHPTTVILDWTEFGTQLTGTLDTLRTQFAGAKLIIVGAGTQTDPTATNSADATIADPTDITSIRNAIAQTPAIV